MHITSPETWTIFWKCFSKGGTLRVIVEFYLRCKMVKKGWAVKKLISRAKQCEVLHQMK